MGVEVVGFESVPSSTEAEKTALHENGTKEHIKFGSHENGSVEGEANQVPSANFPSNAADEWPEPPQVHSFYFVRWKSHDDPKMKSKLDYADKEIARLRQAEFQLKDKLRQKRSERREIIGELKPLNEKNRGFKKAFDEKKDKLGDLQEKLGELRTATGRGNGLCSSEKELNDMIRSLNYRIEHESIPLTEEKQILREIKQLESTRGKVIDLAAKRAQIQEQLHKDGVEDEVKSISVSLDEVRKDQQPLWERINTLQRPLKELEEEIACLEADMEEVLEKKRKVNADFEELMKLRWKGNQDYHDSRTVLFKAKEHAVSRDVRALQELSHVKVEEFMSKWVGDKSFREDYQKRLLQSLDGRQMSKDGRTRNPGEKLLVAVEVVPTPAPPKTPEAVAFKSKAEKETPAATTKVQTKKAADDESKDKEDGDVVKPANDSVRKSEVDVEKLKEMKREEQIAKAKQALERKKKLAEKNAAKAAVKAQKEAEKKLKEQEKKAAKKKGATSSPVIDNNSEEQTDAEKVDPAPETPPIPATAAVGEKKVGVVHKEKSASVKYRGGKARESIPKIIPKRKKSTNYGGVWGAAAAVALLVILIALGYYYLV